MVRLWEELAGLVARHLGISPDDVVGHFSEPPRPEMGDLSLPCFPFAKALRQAPPAIAQQLAGLSWASIPWLDRVEAMGPYLNFRTRPGEVAQRVLSEVASAGESYGCSQDGAGQTVVIDYSSPNIAKHLAVHHLRSTMIGNALARLFRASGYAVVGINHLGDWGTSFGQIMTGWDLFGAELGFAERPLEQQDDPIGALNQLYTRFHEAAKSDATLMDRAREWFQRLEAGDGAARSRWQRIRDVSQVCFDRVYQRLGVRFEEVIGESFFQDRMQPVIDELEARGLLEESDDAQVVRLDDPNLPPMLIRKQDGSTLYGTRDLAAADYRWQRWHFARCLYVVDAGQGLHFRLLFGVLAKLDREYSERLEHVEFGVMRLSVDGQWVKGRTRHGKVVLLEDVLDAARDAALAALKEKGNELENPEQVAEAVGIASVVFADLKARRVKDVNFDLEQMTSFEGETGPYLQYTHVRFCALLRKGGDGLTVGVGARLVAPEELTLIKEIGRFPEIVRRATREAEPSVVSQYLLGLGSSFNSYYSAHRILAEDPELAADRLRLVGTLRQVLASGLRLLGIEPLDRM